MRIASPFNIWVSFFDMGLIGFFGILISCVVNIGSHKL